MTKQQEEQQRQQQEKHRQISKGKEADLDPAKCFMQLVELCSRSGFNSFITKVSNEDASAALKLVPISHPGEDIHEIFPVRIKSVVDHALQAGVEISFINNLILILVTHPFHCDRIWFADSTKRQAAVCLSLVNLWHLLVQQDALPSPDVLPNLVPGVLNALVSLTALSATSRALLVTHIVSSLGNTEERRSAEETVLLQSMQPQSMDGQEVKSVQ